MNALPKRVKRKITTEEHINRYFRAREKQYLRRTRLAAIFLDRNGFSEVLQVMRVLETDEGLIVEVR